MDKMASLDISHPDGMAVFRENDKHIIILVGHVGVVKKNWPLIKATIDEAKKEAKELKSTVHEEKELKAWQVRYLCAVDFAKEVNGVHKKVKVTFDRKAYKILLVGPKSDVNAVLVDMYQQLQGVRSCKMDMGKENMHLLQNPATEARISSQMRRQNLADVWEVRSGDLIVYNEVESDLYEMQNVVKKVLVKTTISLDEQMKGILNSRKWNQKKLNLECFFSKCLVFNLNTGQNCLEIFTIDEVKDRVVSELQGFLSKFATYTEQMTVDPCVALFITRNFDKEIKKLVEDIQKSEKLRIKFKIDGTVDIAGTHSGLKSAKSIVSRLENSVKHKQHTIKQPNIQVYMATERWNETKQNLEKIIPCILEVSGAGLRRSHQDHVQRKPSQSFSKATRCAEATLQGVKVTVIGGNMLELDVDVIVNAANKEMNHVGGLAAVIIKKGGTDIQDDCNDFVKKNGKLSDGDVYMGSPGSLKVKAIAHAVGPVWNGGRAGERKSLINAITNCLTVSEKHNYRSIAFPALSCGMFAYPVDQACLAIVEAIDQHVDGKSSLKDVFLCDINENTVAAFVQALKQVSRNTNVLGPSYSSHSHEQPHRRGTERTPGVATGPNTGLGSCTVKIYAESIGKIDEAIKIIQKNIDEQWFVKELKDSTIHSLHQTQMDAIREEAEKNQCHVDIDQDRGIVTLRGLDKDVLAVSETVHNILRKKDISQYERNHAQQMKTMVKWKYVKGDKEFPFPDRINLAIETAYKEKKANVRVKDKTGGEYEIDFKTMEEKDVKNPANKFPVIRHDLFAEANTAIPKSWQPMKDKDKLLEVTLKTSSPEYQTVVKEFTATLGRTPKIIKIERIQNRTLNTQYEAKKAQINLANGRKNNERVLWHGTAAEAVPSINGHGFNRSYRVTCAYGNGVYFAVNSQYSDSGYSSADASGHKRMYRCLVLTGDACVGKGGMIMPPAKKSAQPHVLYDSVSDNPGSPTMFIVFNDMQAYPEHLITYQ